MPRPKKEKPNHGNLYEVKITLGKTLNGKLIRKSFYSSISKADARKQAEEWKVAQHVADIAGEIFVEKDATFADWARKWLETYKKPNVDENTYLNSYRGPLENHIIPYFGRADLKSIKPIDIQRFYDKMKKYSDSMLSKIQMILNGLFESAIDNDLLTKNPAKNLDAKSKKEPKEKLVYTNEQIEAVEDYSMFQMPEIVVLLETGLRRGELLGLKWEDVDFQNMTISVSRSLSVLKGGKIIEKPPKWKSYRTNPMSKKAAGILQSRDRISEYIFPNKDGAPQRPDTWAAKLKKFMTKMSYDCGVPALTAHELRHTYGTKLRRDGIDIYTIQKVMGHKDIKVTTEIYVKNEVETLRRALSNSL